MEITAVSASFEESLVVIDPLQEQERRLHNRGRRCTGRPISVCRFTHVFVPFLVVARGSAPAVRGVSPGHPSLPPLLPFPPLSCLSRPYPLRYLLKKSSVRCQASFAAA